MAPCLWFEGVTTLLKPTTTRPTSVRLRKDVSRARIKGSIDIEFTDEPLSAYTGLELFGRFLVSAGRFSGPCLLADSGPIRDVFETAASRRDPIIEIKLEVNSDPQSS